MNISLSKLLAIPFVLATILLLYLAIEVDKNWSIYILPSIIVLVALYFFQPAIDWWWFNKYPPDVDTPLKELFEKRILYYQRLSEENKKRFRTRVALYIEANDFQPKVFETVPEDIKGLIAASVVQLTFGFEDDFRLKAFERIVIYPGTFPSPQFPETFHASEAFEEDGVTLFAVDHLMPGAISSQQYFNISLYEYAKVFRLSHPELKYPTLEENTWIDYEKISLFPKDKVEAFVGLKDLDIWAVGVTYFFSFPERFKIVNPELYLNMANTFNQNPEKTGNPVIAQTIKK